MYAPFFGLSKEPFSIAPDPRFLFMSEQHREALAHLLYGVGAGGGFVLLTGEIGAGKTTVCRCFLEQVPARCAVAYVFNPKLTAVELLQTVCGEFGIAPPEDAGSVKAHVDALNAFLLSAHAQGRQAVLVIDEAQALSADVLEQLRLLTNLETAERKLLQIVLIGQPELREMLARPGLEQLAQRVIARYHLGPLSFVETQRYIRHRLSVAGPRAALPFEKKALARIHALSKGVPRRINLLADRALLGAYSQGQSRADRRTVEQAAREVFGADPAARASPGWAWAGAAAVVVGGTAIVWPWLGGAWPWSAGAAASSTSSSASSASLASSASSAAAAAASASRAAAPVLMAAPASAAAASAPDAAPSEPAAPPPDSDPGPLVAAAHADAATAWRELALRWNVAVGEGDPCVAVVQAQLACFRSTGGGLPVVRQLARPGVVALRGSDGSAAYALLLALDDRGAALQAGDRRFVLTLAALASVWRGDFATLWRTPPGWREGVDAAAAPASRAWIEQQLAGSGPGGERPLGERDTQRPLRERDTQRPLRERVFAFQLAHGLAPDGRAGPMTLMLLARNASSDEPRLAGLR